MFARINARTVTNTTGAARWICRSTNSCRSSRYGARGRTNGRELTRFCVKTSTRPPKAVPWVSSSVAEVDLPGKRGEEEEDEECDPRMASLIPRHAARDPHKVLGPRLPIHEPFYRIKLYSSKETIPSFVMFPFPHDHGRHFEFSPRKIWTSRPVSTWIEEQNSASNSICKCFEI